MMTKVYAYGCDRVPPGMAAAVREQLLLAHRYRLALWNLDMAGRTLYREQRREHCPELAKAEEDLARVTELLSITDRKEMPKEHHALKVEMQRLRAQCRELRLAAKENAALIAANAEAKRLQGVLQRALRNVFSRTYGLYSGTYLHVEAAARSANGGKEDPVRPLWRGTGVLAIQLQGGRTPAQIHSGNDPSIWIERPSRQGGRKKRSQTHATYRVASRSGKPVAFRTPLMFHRDLPADARVTWAKLVVTRRVKQHGDCLRYSLQLTVQSDLHGRKEFGEGEVAVSFKDDLVTYAGRGEAPRTYRLDMREGAISGLQSVRDKLRNQTIGALVRWCENQDEPPEWLLDELDAIENGKSCRRLYRLRSRLNGVIDHDVQKMLDEWAYRENHLYAYQGNMRETKLRRRKDEHRCFAAMLRRKYRTLIVDSRILSSPERMTDERRWLGLHELRLALIQSFGPGHHAKVSGDSCEHLIERFDAKQTDDDQTEAIIEAGAKKTRSKRTGFARKHEARKSRSQTPAHRPCG